MSRKGHNRAASACRALTGTPYEHCAVWEKQRLISRTCPVPDANTADQRSFEALIVSTLANALGDRQLGAAFGAVDVFPAPDYISLRLHPVMATRVLWELLPRYDAEYGGVLGVPGMRLSRSRGKIVLLDLMSQARVYVVQVGDPRAMMHRLISTEQPLWLNGPSGLHGSEATDRAYWAADRGRRASSELAAGRDWLLSRMLRRPHLVNRTCQAHGWANTYTHGYEDVVIEYCCDDHPANLRCCLEDAGVTAWPDDSRLGKAASPVPGDLDSLVLGAARVILRRGYCSGASPDLALRISDRIEWYR